MSQSKQKRLRKENRINNPPPPPKKSRKRLYTTLCAIALALILLVLVIFNTGILPRSLTAVNVGDVKISAAEYNYFYINFISTYLNDSNNQIIANLIDTSTPLSKQMLSETESFADFFKMMALSDINNVVAMSEEARRNGMYMSDDEKVSVLKSIQNSADSAQMTVDRYLEQYYGGGVTPDVILQAVERIVLSQRYSSDELNSYTFTDEEINAYYEEHRLEYLKSSYRIYKLNGEADTSGQTLTSEEVEAANNEAMDKAREDAKSILTKIVGEDSFNSAVEPYMTEEEKEKLVEDADYTLRKDMANSAAETEISEWLYDVSRKAGDKLSFDTTGGVYVVYFISSGRDETPGNDVRHILASFSSAGTSATPTQEQIDEAKNKAEEILEEWNAGDKTEDSFIALAKAKTDDTGSKDTGGLISNVRSDSGLVEAFLNWSIDEARKPGETEIIETEYGYHVMYYVGKAEPVWYQQCKAAMINEKFAAHLQDDLMPKYGIGEDGLGMMFTIKDPNLS